MDLVAVAAAIIAKYILTVKGTAANANVPGSNYHLAVCPVVDNQLCTQIISLNSNLVAFKWIDSHLFGA